MSTESLRSLSRRYATGGLTRAEYRRRRAALLEGIVAGTIPIDVPLPEEPITETLSGPTLKQIRLREEPAAKSPRPRRRGGWRWIGLGAATALAVAVGLLLNSRAPSPKPTPRPAFEPAISATKPATLPPLVADFLLRKDWSTTALETLLADVQRLGGAERSMLARDPGIARFSDGLYEQLNEERTLMEVDQNLTSPARQQTIMDLAEALRIEDPRLSDAARALAALREQAVQAAAEGGPATAPPPAAEASAPVPSATAALPTATETTPPVTTEAATATPVSPESAPPATVAGAAAGTAGPTVDAAASVAPVAIQTAPAPAAAAVVAAPATTAAPASGQDATPAAATAPAPTATTATAATATAATATAAAAARKRGCHSELARSRRPFCRDALRAGAGGPIMVVVPGGEFTMGGNQPSEQPAHSAKIDYPFAIAAYETTVREFKAFCAATGRKCPPQPWGAEDYPVVNVTWADASAYAQWLRAQTGQNYRLPSETEWEYAARAGTRTRYPFGDELLPTHARFSYSAPADSPLPVSDKTVNRNRFRLYHMIGNVREWVADAWHDNLDGAPTDGAARGQGNATAVVRGGSYKNGADQLSSATRQPQPASQADSETGFRVAIDFRADSRAGRATDVEGLAWRR
jgi:formylglycine-generating enzyme required for sulfatase activity